MSQRFVVVLSVLVSMFASASKAQQRVSAVGPAVDTPPVFAIQPADLRTFDGQAAQFSVNVSGSPFPTCQWQISADLGATWTNLTNTAPYSGVTTNFMNVSATTLAMSGTQFRCLASNTAATVPSNAATLSVAIPSAGGSPAAGSWTGTFTQGGNVAFAVTSGLTVTSTTYNTVLTCAGSYTYGPTIVPDPIYGDRFRVDGFPSCPASVSFAGNFTSATTALGILTYTTGPLCACQGQFQAPWSASNGPTSAAAPQILAQPTTQSPPAGQKARFTMAASGRPFATIQWQVSTNGGGAWSNVPNTTPYSGATTPTLTILSTGVPALHAAQFRAVAQNASGSITTDQVALIAPGQSVPPTTSPDGYTTSYQTTLNVAAPGVLGNDMPNGGGAMTAQLVTPPASGALSLNADGSFTYAPAAGFSGNDPFTYRAVTAGGPGNTATVALIVQGAGVPAAPSNFRIVRMQGNLVTFAMTPPAVGAAPTGYLLEGGLAPGTTLGALTLGPAPSTTISLPTGSFYLRVRAIAGLGLSAASNEILAHVNVPVTPSAPANLLGMASGNVVQLAWTPTFGGGAATGAVLDVSGPLSGSLPLGPAETFNYPAMPAGTFTFSVRQSNAGGTSPASNPVTLTFPSACTGAPQAPTNFVAFKSGGQLTLQWEPPTAGAAPASYVLDVTGAFTGSLPMGGRSLTVGAPAGGSFTFAVRATNACGSSAATAAQTVSFP